MGLFREGWGGRRGRGRGRGDYYSLQWVNHGVYWRREGEGMEIGGHYNSLDMDKNGVC